MTNIDVEYIKNECVTTLNLAGETIEYIGMAGEHVCSVCGCSVEELDEDVYYCKKCDVCN